MTTRTKILYFYFIMIVTLCSCDRYDKSIILNFDAESSTVHEKNLIRDSIVIRYYSNDSILLLKYSNGDYKQSRFFNMNNVFFERRKRVTEVGEYMGIDTILTFSQKDTIFEYKSARRFIPLVQDFSYADCIYIIKQESNEYRTIKQSVIDTTYKEIFFYDRNYKIYKFINTWQDDKCVYVKKE